MYVLGMSELITHFMFDAYLHAIIMHNNDNATNSDSHSMIISVISLWFIGWNPDITMFNIYIKIWVRIRKTGRILDILRIPDIMNYCLTKKS